MRYGMRGPLFRGVALLLAVTLAGCVTALPPLPAVPLAPIEKVRTSITALTAPSPVPPLPEIKTGLPPVELQCQRSSQTPTVWLCTGSSPHAAGGTGLFFAYDGAAEELRQRLATERLLRELIPVLQSRIEVRDRALQSLMDLLDTMVLMAEEYRTLAEIRGVEITRLKRDQILDRITLLVPLVGGIIGAMYIGGR